MLSRILRMNQYSEVETTQAPPLIIFTAIPLDPLREEKSNAVR